MAKDNADQEKPNISVNVPIGGIATLLLLGLAAVGYMMASRKSEPESQSVTEKAMASGRNVRRRLGLMTVITLIENDSTRKLVLALLRAMARRA
jgi:hypothetical protein